MVPIGAEPHYGILVIVSLRAVALRDADAAICRSFDAVARRAAYYAGTPLPRPPASVSGEGRRLPALWITRVIATGGVFDLRP